MRTQTMSQSVPTEQAPSKLRETISAGAVYTLIALTAALMVAGMVQRSRGTADCCAPASADAE